MQLNECPICGINSEKTRIYLGTGEEAILYKCPLEGLYSLSPSLNEYLLSKATPDEKAIFQYHVTSKTNSLLKDKTPPEQPPHFTTLTD
ncbi:hypothetical protein QNN88_01960 [Citrobacter sp. ANG330]|uniref:hypothetical protein n=1 Tax=Citrobacter sp. ANG330 TaxID=3048142 RepID=UPI0039C24F8D